MMLSEQNPQSRNDGGGDCLHVLPLMEMFTIVKRPCHKMVLVSGGNVHVCGGPRRCKGGTLLCRTQRHTEPPPAFSFAHLHFESRIPSRRGVVTKELEELEMLAELQTLLRQ